MVVRCWSLSKAQVKSEGASLDDVNKEDLVGLLSDKKQVIREVVINENIYYLGALWYPLSSATSL